MKILTLLLSTILLSGPAFADLQEEYTAIKKQEKMATKAYYDIRYAPEFDKDGEYKKADAEYMKAAKDWKKVREEHPVLKKFADEEKRYIKEMAELKPGSDEFVKLKKEYSAHWAALNKASQELPELIAAKEKMNSSAIELRAVEKRLLEASPAAMAALKKKDEIVAKRKELRKKIKAQAK